MKIFRQNDWVRILSLTHILGSIWPFQLNSQGARFTLRHFDGCALMGDRDPDAMTLLNET